MSSTFADVVVQTPAHSYDVQAVARCYAGIAEVRRTDGVWTCSCGGAPTCAHVAAVELEIEVLA